MARPLLRRFGALLLLLPLLAARAGQQIHIYTENPLHFAAYCSELVPDNGASEGMSERCVVDDFYFFPFLQIAPAVHLFYATPLVVLHGAATRCRCGAPAHNVLLRAPPVTD